MLEDPHHFDLPKFQSEPLFNEQTHKPYQHKGQKFRPVASWLKFFFIFVGLGFFYPDLSLSCNLTGATLSWASDDAGEIFINGNLANICPNGCWTGTGTNNISIPTAWFNTSGDNILAAYGYATDTLFSASTWLLTLTYSDCANTYMQTGDPCVLSQYLFDSNSATGPPLAASFPASWNNTSFIDSSWAAPATTGPSPAICSCDVIPSPYGGNVPWTWGKADWMNVAVGDGYMYREHFQVGFSCSAFTPMPTSTPTNTPTITPTSTPTLSLTPTQTFTPTVTLPPTATFTPTCVTHVWPDPYNPNYAIGGFLKVDCLPLGAVVSLYTVSGELVRSLTENSGLALWDGRNQEGAKVSPGIYYYVILQGTQVYQSGKFLVLNTT
ncbi:MAG TPA: hypothetical protein VIJ93_12740 [bacterium]